MKRSVSQEQVRRVLLLVAGKRRPSVEANQLELPFGGPPQTPLSNSDSDLFAERLHGLALEIVVAIQMEAAGIVASPLGERRRRLRLGSLPSLRLLEEWGRGPLLDEDPWAAGTPAGGREQAYALGLGRARQLASSLELRTGEVREMARRLYPLAVRATPEDDLPGLIHSHGLRHRLEPTPRGRLGFRLERGRSRSNGVLYTPAGLVREVSRAVLNPALAANQGTGHGVEENGGEDAPALLGIQILDPACGSGQFLLAAARRLARREGASSSDGASSGSAGAASFVAGLARLRQLHGVDLDPQVIRIAAHNLSYWAAREIQASLGESPGAEAEPRPAMKGTMPNAQAGHLLDGLLGPTFPYLLGTNLQVGNALHCEASSLGPGFVWERRFPQVFDRSTPGFDVVFGNPPWVSYGLRDRIGAPAELREYFQRLFPAGTQYKLSLYPLFIELAMRLCRSGGHHGFLVPDSLLTGHHFSRIRARLLEEADLLELALVESAPWADAQVGFTAFYAVRRKGGISAPSMVKNKILRTARNISRPHYPLPPRGESPGREEQGPDGEGDAPGVESIEVRVPSDLYRSTPGGPFRIFRDLEEMEFLTQLQRSPLRFRDVIWTYSGLIARHGQKSVQAEKAEPEIRLRDRRGSEVLVDRAASPRWHPALLSGGEIAPYHVAWQGGWVYVPSTREDLTRVYKSGFDLERYRGPKVFLRQTGDRLIAAVDRDGFFCLNNIHLLGSTTETGIPPLLLVGILMSRPLQRAYRIFSLELSRPLAQVDLKTVESLPYPTDPSGFPLGAAPAAPRSHPQSRRILRNLERWVKRGETSRVLEAVDAAFQAGPSPLPDGPFPGREVVSLILLRLLELREVEAGEQDSFGPEVAAASPHSLQELLDEVFSLFFRVDALVRN